MLNSILNLLPLLALVSSTPLIKRQDGVLIESGRNPGQCLSVQGGRVAVTLNKIGNGTPVITLDCKIASLWDISKGSGSVMVEGTNYALDLGLSPSNNGGLKVWQSYPGSPQQTFYLTDDNRIAQTGGNQCLDQGDNGPQTYQCTTGNTNQVWNAHLTTIIPPALFLSDITPGPVPINDVPNSGQRIRLFNRQDLVVMVADGYAAVGTRVMLYNAIGSGGGQDLFQLFDLPTGTGQVKLHGNPNNLCLDAGDNPTSGSAVKVWTCGPYPQQQWTFVGGHLRTANNQCLDVKKESVPLLYHKPYGSQRDLQTWECSTNKDPFMAFTIQP